MLVVYVAPERTKVSANSRRNARYFLIESPLNGVGSLSCKRVVPDSMRGGLKSVEGILKTSLVPIGVVLR